MNVTGSTVLDLVLVVVLVAYTVSGFRQGVVVGVLSLAGFVGGAVLGVMLLPALLDTWAPGTPRSLLMLAGVLLLAWCGQILGLLLGRHVRSGMTAEPLRAVDAALGAVAALLAVSLVVWFVASALRGGPVPSVSRAVGGSVVVGTIDRVVPPVADRVVDRLRATVRAGDFPRVFEGLGSEVILPVEPPDPTVVGPVAAAAAESVVKIQGEAPDCGRGQEGSGWVVAPERVVTNAHVVAGVPEPQVTVAGEGRPLPASVVVFDPQRDLAVLAVPDLPAEPLPLGEDLSRTDTAVVVGFPRGGPFDARPARVRQVVDARGEDIYGSPGVVRQVYSLATEVEPGSSGGPLVDTGGAVVGVVFARSLDDAGTGYALTLRESEPVLTAAETASEPVDVSGCTPG